MNRFTFLIILINLLFCAIPCLAQNVGVNTTSPEFSLDIRGQVMDTGAVMNLASQNGSHFLRLFSGRLNDPHPFIWWSEGESLRFAVGDGMGQFIERMRIRSGGTIGINNQLPQYALHVNGPLGTSLGSGIPLIFGEYVENNLADVVAIKGVSKPSDYYGIGGLFEGGWIGMEGTVNPTGSNSYYGVRGNVFGGSGTNYGIYGAAYGSGTNWAGYFAGGNVFIQERLGIGEASPQWPIDILSDQAVSRMVSISSTFGSVLELRNNTGSPTYLGAINFNNNGGTYPGQIGYTGNNKMVFRTDGAERMNIDADGNVNIGTTSFLGIRLNVDGGLGKFHDGIVAEDHTGGVNNTAIYGSASGASGTNWSGYFADGDVYVADDLRIGTTVPATGYKVSVKGKVMCEELKVQLQANWPDYVFSKDYALLPLHKLEKEIVLKGHLPGIPSASEIERNGLEVGEMQRVMIEKIEELTLYIISLQKQIDLLQAQIQNQ